jgi:hypothetical protein
VGIHFSADTGEDVLVGGHAEDGCTSLNFGTDAFVDLEFNFTVVVFVPLVAIGDLIEW